MIETSDKERQERVREEKGVKRNEKYSGEGGWREERLATICYKI